jgi:hypothetical protein
MHFLARAKLEFRTLIHVKNSMNGRRRVSSGQRNRLSGMDGSDNRREEKQKLEKRRHNVSEAGRGQKTNVFREIIVAAFGSGGLAKGTTPGSNASGFGICANGF